MIWSQELLHELVRFSADYVSELSLWADPSHRQRHLRPVQLPVNAAPASEQPIAAEARDKKLIAKARMLEMHRRKRQALVS